VAPLDPGRHWLAAGITGLARQRVWDAVATVDAPGAPGDEAQLVVLEDGRILVEAAPPGLDVAALADALRGTLEPPYRAVAVRRAELWAIGAVAIETAELEPDPRGEALTLIWDGDMPTLVRDGFPADPATASALREVAARRIVGPYAASARRLEGTVWEVSVLPL
jgi:hypothetical protein